MLCCSALIVAGALVGSIPLALAVAVVQIAVASGWHDLVGAAGAVAGSLTGLSVGLVATALLAASWGGRDIDVGKLAPLAAAGLVATVVLGLLSERQGRSRLDSLTATAALILVEVLAACWLSAGAISSGTLIVGLGVVGCAVGFVAVVLGGTAWWTVLLALAVASFLGGVGAQLGSSPVSSSIGAGIAAVACLAGVCGGQVRRVAGRSARLAPATVAALPLALAGPATYAAARILAG